MRRALFILGILAGLALALHAGWRVERWRDAEEEKRLRERHTLSDHGKVLSDSHFPVFGEERSVRADPPSAGGERSPGL
jgi:hypothetical protein